MSDEAAFLLNMVFGSLCALSGMLAAAWIQGQKGGGQ